MSNNLMVNGKRNIKINGVKNSLQNGLLLASTGNSSLDTILGGGMTLGSILLIEEDKYVSYSTGLTKLFLSEGIVHKHGIFLAKLEEDPKEFIKKIPAPFLISNGVDNTEPTSPNKNADNMTIAWRYNVLPTVEAELVTNTAEHFFDLTQQIDVKMLSHSQTIYFSGKIDQYDRVTIFKNKMYCQLLREIHLALKKVQYNPNTDNTAIAKNVLRLSLNSIGSSLWYEENFSHDICLFLTILRALIRNSLVVCCITMPTHLFKFIDESLIHRIRNLVDYSIELESFAGSDKATNPIFKEYHGLLYVRKINALNTLAAFTPETQDLAFKMKRKKFVIEKLHLPPEFEELKSPTEKMPSIGCGSSSKHLLEF